MEISNNNHIHKLLSLLPAKGQRITPQRILVYEAICNSIKHPTAENILEYIKNNHPNIAIGTIYNTLEILVNTGIINKIKTESDIMRYDANTESHHHLYSTQSSKIEDYFDEELTVLITEYFKKKELPDFEIRDIQVQINGDFRN